jgi:small-conductance mechanosensitive channel
VRARSLASRRELAADTTPTTGEVTDEISDSATTLVDQIAGALPRIGVAVAIVAIGWLTARLFRIGVRRLLLRRNGPSFSTVMSKLASWVLLGLVVGAALAITFPSVQPVDLLAGLGFFSVAVGFAFQDILENTLSGVLLLFRQPFVAGDQIAVDGNEGAVEAVTIRETRIRQYDGQLLVVPNRDVYKNAIRVQTSRADRRIEVVVGVGYGESLERVERLIVDAIGRLDEIRSEPAPTALVSELNASTVDLVVRCWADSAQFDGLVARDAVIRAIKSELDLADVDLPFTIVTLDVASPPRPAGSSTPPERPPE